MRKLFAGGDFFEGARWHDGAWWVSDIFGAKVRRISPDGEARVVAEVEHWPSGLGWLPNGDMLVISIKDQRILRLDRDGALHLHAELAPHMEFWPNDMLVDRQGRAWVGHMGVDLVNGGRPGPSTLVRIDPDGSGAVVASGLLFPNGIVSTQDGNTLIVCESLGNRLTAFTVEADGSLGDQRVWASFGPEPPASEWTMDKIHDIELAPDGSAIDREDNVWVADAANRRACRIAHGGKILEEVRAPEGERIYACALGGPDGHSLVICAAPSSDIEEARGRAVLYEQRVEVPAR